MLFGKKEDKAKLPDLPSPKRSFNSKQSMAPPGVDAGGSPLPAFPESPGQGKTLQVDEPEKLGEPIPGRNLKVVEMEEWEPSSPPREESFVPKEPPEMEEESEEESKPMGLPKPPLISEPPAKPVVMKEASPADVFVRIDKFHSARRALTEIANRLEDIDELVKKIRDTKLREEQELTAWEKDITHIKSRVQTVSENIFEKVE